MFSTTCIDLALAMLNGENCNFALHDALLECGNYQKLADHLMMRENHTHYCWVLKIILGQLNYDIDRQSNLDLSLKALSQYRCYFVDKDENNVGNSLISTVNSTTNWTFCELLIEFTGHYIFRNNENMIRDGYLVDESNYFIKTVDSITIQPPYFGPRLAHWSTTLAQDIRYIYEHKFDKEFKRISTDHLYFSGNGLRQIT